jgi:hypothetical protein
VHQDRVRTKIDDVFDAMAEIGPTRGNPVSGLRSTDPAFHQAAISSARRSERTTRKETVLYNLTIGAAPGRFLQSIEQTKGFCVAIRSPHLAKGSHL